MVKIHTTISIDNDLLEKAKDHGLNISSEVERKLRERLHEKIDGEEEELKCKFCGRKDVRQTKEDLTKGLVWLCPDEVWCCESCLTTFKRKISIVSAIR